MKNKQSKVLRIQFSFESFVELQLNLYLKFLLIEIDNQSLTVFFSKFSNKRKVSDLFVTFCCIDMLGEFMEWELKVIMFKNYSKLFKSFLKTKVINQKRKNYAENEVDFCITDIFAICTLNCLKFIWRKLLKCLSVQLFFNFLTNKCLF